MDHNLILTRHGQQDDTHIGLNTPGVRIAAGSRMKPARNPGPSNEQRKQSYWCGDLARRPPLTKPSISGMQITTRLTIP